MNKQEFLEKLRKRLSILEDNEIEDIITEYSGYIDEKIKKKKKTEEEAIEDFGNFDELVKEILSAYKIDGNKNKFENKVMGFFDEVGQTIDALIKEFSNKDFSDIMKFIIEVIVVIFIIIIFKWPVDLLIDLGREVFKSLPAVGNALADIWRFIFEISYVILAIIFFFRIFKERYVKNIKIEPKEEKTEEVKETKKTAKSAKKEETVYVAKRKEEDNSFSKTVGKTFGVFFRIMGVFFFIPCLVMLIGLVVAFSIGISLVVSGIPYYGVLLILFAGVLFSIIVVELVFSFVINRRVSSTRIFISILATIILFGAGISMTAIEFADTTYVNEVPSQYITNKKTITKEFLAEEIKYVSHYYSSKLIADESLKDTIRIEMTYYEGFANPNIIQYGDELEIDWNYRERYSLNKFYNLFVDDLKNKEFYAYYKLFDPQIKIYSSQENLDRIFNYYTEDMYDDLYDQLDDLRDERDEWREKYYDLYYD